LRIADLVPWPGTISISKLSRIERRTVQRITMPLLAHLLSALHLGVSSITEQTWHATMVAQAITCYTRGELPAMRRTLRARGLLVTPCPPATLLLAEVLRTYSEGGPGTAHDPAVMLALVERAEHEQAWPAAAWACVFATEAHEARGRADAAVAAAMLALRFPRDPDTTLPLLCLAAAAGRALSRCPRPAAGLTAIGAAYPLASDPFPLALLQRAEGLVHEALGATDRAVTCLSNAARTARRIPNLTLAADTWHELGHVYGRHGHVDAGSAMHVRAASLYRHAGRVRDAATALQEALQLADADQDAV